MQTWTENCKENFEHQYLLISAEMARIQGETSEAIENYEKAIQSAKQGDFIQNEALIKERYAHFWLGRENAAVGELYVREALTDYHRWGATAKVADLQERYPDLLRPSTPAENTFGNPMTVLPEDSFDFASAIKASQTISSEIELPRLLEKLMQIMIENAGAQTGVLVLKKSEKFYVESVGSAKGGGRSAAIAASGKQPRCTGWNDQLCKKYLGELAAQ